MYKGRSSDNRRFTVYVFLFYKAWITASTLYVCIKEEAWITDVSRYMYFYLQSLDNSFHCICIYLGRSGNNRGFMVYVFTLEKAVYGAIIIEIPL